MVTSDLSDADLSFAWWSYLSHVNLSSALLEGVPCAACGLNPKYLLADGNWFAKSRLPDYVDIQPNDTAW